MNSDIETILSAFTGNWKPGIEEQSIRMAHAVAKQGDTSTASNILKFIAIPESMKLQILGASLAPATAAATAPVTPAVQSDSVVTPAKLMPEPLLTDTGPVGSMQPLMVSEQDVANATMVSAIPVNPAFATELSPATSDSAIVSGSLPLPPTVPSEALPHQRQQLFNQAFASVQEKDAYETSRPLVRDADNIPVIHTYAEPEPSVRAMRELESEQSQKGVKLFQTLESMLTRAMTSSDESVRSAATVQWGRLNTEFPDYQKFHRLEWSRLEGMVSQLLLPPTITSSMTAALPPVESSVLLTADPILSMPVSVVQQSEPSAVAPKVASTSGGSYFALKQSNNNQDIPPVENVAAPEIFVSADDPVKIAETMHLDEYTLPSGLHIGKQMTITGASVYRISDIQQNGSTVSVVFTDEIHSYRVPSLELDTALADQNTQPDTFFKQFTDV